MTLDEAIKRAEEEANANERLCETVHPAMQLSDYGKRAEEHRQLAEWLKDYKRLLEQQSCGDAISRQSAIFLANDLKQDLPDDERIADMVMAHNEGILEYQTQLSLLPPVTPHPKTGHWMIDEDSTDRFFATYECSCCKRAIIVPHDVMKAVYKDYPFCHCGAKMGKRSDKE